MFGSFSDFGRTVVAMDALRRQVERAFGDVGAVGPVEAEWPRITLHETGEALVLTADVPGLGEQDVQLSLREDVLSLSGKRAGQTPAGYVVHRQERRPLSFARSFALPCAVKADEVAAQIKDGVLTVTLPKAPEAQPRQITVKTV
jgi:HSP20 family protein